MAVIRSTSAKGQWGRGQSITEDKHKQIFGKKPEKDAPKKGSIDKL